MRLYLCYFWVCLALIPILVSCNEGLPSTMCPRYHVEEFIGSLFTPTLKKNLDFVLSLVKTSTDNVEELLLKMEEKKGSDGNIEKVNVKEAKEIKEIVFLCQKG